MILNIFILLALPLITIAEPSEKQSNLTLEVTNISDSEGQLVVSIFNNEKQFPKEPFRTLNIPKQQNSNVTLTPFFLEAGTYAIIVLDDSNTNGKMDYRFGVYPKEAFGFSNNAKVTGMKSPTFEDCLFEIVKDQKVKISVVLEKM